MNHLNDETITMKLEICSYTDDAGHYWADLRYMDGEVLACSESFETERQAINSVKNWIFKREEGYADTFKTDEIKLAIACMRDASTYNICDEQKSAMNNIADFLESLVPHD